jgi:hypothetical protein
VNGSGVGNMWIDREDREDELETDASDRTERAAGLRTSGNPTSPIDRGQSMSKVTL